MSVDEPIANQKRQPKAQFQIILKAEGPASEQETIRRLRAALKVLRRVFGLRAVSVLPAPPQPSPAAAAERQAAA
jgi:hypothetical protein